MSSPLAALSKYTGAIEHAIKTALEPAPPFIGGVARYHFGWVDQDFKPIMSKPGKMLRPALCLLTVDALTGQFVDALPLATAVEIIHNFSLVHDDIEDEDLERRGRPTAWAVWGKPLAINVGDYLYTLAHQCLYQLDTAKFSPQKILTVLRIVNQACLDLTMGQDLDLRFEQLHPITTDMYLDMVYKKTGALLEAAIVGGATLGTSNQTIINNYQGFAKNIGIAFQIRDDILGIWGDTSQTGKSVDNDLRRKKKTLPIIFALNQASDHQQEQLVRLYTTATPLTDREIEFVRECLHTVEARDYAQQTANRYIEAAFSALYQTGITGQPQQILETISKHLVERTR